jgi:hypothetical protein
VRPGSLIIISSVATILSAATARAQVDNEAVNGIEATADDLGINAINTAILNQATFVGGGNDVDYFSASLNTLDVFMGMSTPIAGLPADFGAPDTILRLTVPIPPATVVYSDNDGGSEMPGALNRGSLFRFIAPMGGTYPVGISGSGDLEFDGATTGAGHAQTGDYLLTAAHVSSFQLGGDFGDTDGLNDTSAGADLVVLNATGAAVSVAELTAVGDDVDFFALPGLTAGQILSAMTSPLANADDAFNGDFDAPNTVLGLFDSNGVLLTNDDAGDVDAANGNAVLDDLGSDSPLGSILGSALRAEIPLDGDYYLAVSGADDFDFDGMSDVISPGSSHGEQGRYALLVSVFGDQNGGGGNPTVPEPGTLLLAALGLWLGAGVPRRRRA